MTKDQELVRTSVALPKWLWCQAKALAAVHQTSLQDVVIEGLLMRLRLPDAKDLLAAEPDPGNEEHMQGSGVR